MTRHLLAGSMLLLAGCTPHGDDRPQARRLESQFEALVAASPSFSLSSDADRETAIAHFLTDEEIKVFVDAGEEGIPILMKHVRDPRQTICCYHNPWSSLFSIDYMTAGRLAMFLLEATLRREVHFAWNKRIFAPAGPPSRTQPGPELTLAQAADAYEKWFEACYDLQTGHIRSSNCVPEVRWSYTKAPLRSDPEGSSDEGGGR